MNRHDPLDADTVEALGLDSTGRMVPDDHIFPYTLGNLPNRYLVMLVMGDRYYVDAAIEITHRLEQLEMGHRPDWSITSSSRRLVDEVIENMRRASYGE